jgi:hypothetical protein
LQCDQYLYKYCFTSCAIKRNRTTFNPDELATTFVALNCERRVDGLFLSSGIVPDADTTMEKMLGTVERLRPAARAGRDHGLGRAVCAAGWAARAGAAGVVVNAWYESVRKDAVTCLIKHSPASKC